MLLLLLLLPVCYCNEDQIKDAYIGDNIIIDCYGPNKNATTIEVVNNYHSYHGKTETFRRLTRNGNLIESISNTKYHIIPSKNYIRLLIINVDVTDAGIYFCFNSETALTTKTNLKIRWKIDAKLTKLFTLYEEIEIDTKSTDYIQMFHEYNEVWKSLYQNHNIKFRFKRPGYYTMVMNGIPIETYYVIDNMRSSASSIYKW